MQFYAPNWKSNAVQSPSGKQLRASLLRVSIQQMLPALWQASQFCPRFMFTFLSLVSKINLSTEIQQQNPQQLLVAVSFKTAAGHAGTFPIIIFISQVVEKNKSPFPACVSHLSCPISIKLWLKKRAKPAPSFGKLNGALNSGPLK